MQFAVVTYKWNTVSVIILDHDVKDNGLPAFTNMYTNIYVSNVALTF